MTVLNFGKYTISSDCFGTEEIDSPFIRYHINISDGSAKPLKFSYTLRKEGLRFNLSSMELLDSVRHFVFIASSAIFSFTDFCNEFGYFDHDTAAAQYTYAQFVRNSFDKYFRKNEHYNDFVASLTETYVYFVQQQFYNELPRNTLN